ncbi:MAG: response regulator transcription factor [Epsilonproteobacteria bacterium]|nr:response regulator transcription factor [Campylobacterota bacterium]
MQIPQRIKDKTILLVEDEKIIRDNLASMLGYFFKEVYTTGDGFDAIDRYERYLPDIIMTDLKMPNMGGFELLHALQKRGSTAYMIIVSAHTDTDLLVNAIHKGVDRYLIKPVTEKALFEAFNAYVKKLNHAMPQTIDLLSQVQFSPDKNEIMVENQKVHLNKKESLLLKLFCSDSAKTFTYEEIEYQVWGSQSMSLPAIRSVVRDLRKKIGSEFITNVSGIGYQLKT